MRQKSKQFVFILYVLLTHLCGLKMIVFLLLFWVWWQRRRWRAY